ncbi:hypothetical protein PGT21_036760 [Puccinia graminis f. sp. tritici]|uniref:Uncharacterized protein n=1 Tax=Puccinia graminis f. sp. tritici TaxID=56615 RepID=A0A5B0PNK6_PUCGR|nr:hypothetical protein PGT21_036760 [Puccinia graminis f. sp. tritici]
MSTYASGHTDGHDYGGGGGGGFMQGELAIISSKYAHLNDRLASIDLPPFLHVDLSRFRLNSSA